MQKDWVSLPMQPSLDSREKKLREKQIAILGAEYFNEMDHRQSTLNRFWPVIEALFQRPVYILCRLVKWLQTQVTQNCETGLQVTRTYTEYFKTAIQWARNGTTLLEIDHSTLYKVVQFYRLYSNILYIYIYICTCTYKYFPTFICRL